MSRFRGSSSLLKNGYPAVFQVTSPAHVRTRSRRIKHLRAGFACGTSMSRLSRLFFNSLLGGLPASKSGFVDLHDRLGAPCHLEFIEDVGDVVSDGAHTDE